jgi:hypothetical protein
MKLEIKYTKENGNISSERIVLQANSRLDVGQFILCDTTYNQDESISNLLRHTFWFPDKIVEDGDFVALYTKSGINTEVKNKSGTTTHVFYWGLEKTIWNRSGDGAVLIEINDWQAKNVVGGNKTT